MCGVRLEKESGKEKRTAWATDIESLLMSATRANDELPDDELLAMEMASSSESTLKLESSSDSYSSESESD
jgi:hypothetical protein